MPAACMFCILLGALRRIERADQSLFFWFFCRAISGANAQNSSLARMRRGSMK